MISKLTALAKRRTRLIAEIDHERESLRSTYAYIRQELVYAGLGLMAGRLLARHTWLRTFSLAALAVFAGGRLAIKSKL
jgi:hypothetical protein